MSKTLVFFNILRTVVSKVRFSKYHCFWSKLAYRHDKPDSPKAELTFVWKSTQNPAPSNSIPFHAFVPRKVPFRHKTRPASVQRSGSRRSSFGPSRRDRNASEMEVWKKWRRIMAVLEGKKRTRTCWENKCVSFYLFYLSNGGQIQS